MQLTLQGAGEGRIPGMNASLGRWHENDDLSDLNMANAQGSIGSIPAKDSKRRGDKTPALIKGSV